ncbi:MAG: hypothetical protein OXE46_15620 [Chloroflexi bacterium]|nr:hypothetical protein [Chloroflexota bacterium]
MNRFLTVLLFLLGISFSSGQEEIYWPDHEGMRLARWSPDSKTIATWGEGPAARIWRDRDGSLAFELDHSELDRALPGGELIARNNLDGLRNVDWSDDGRHILTQAFVRGDLIFQHVWDVDTREEVYSYLWGTKEYFGWYTNNKLHEIVHAGALIASWYDNSMSFTDIDPDSSTFGRELASIDFGELVTWETGRWNKTNDEVLLRLHTGWHTNWRRPCGGCEMFFTLIDADLSSSTFGEILWQSEAAGEASDPIWPNAHDLLAISRTDSVELWDLDRESERFGMRLARMEFSGAKPYDMLYHERSQRLAVVRVAIVEQHRESYRDWERCVVNECEFVVSVWDVDIESRTFGQRLLEIRHPYRLKEDKLEGGYNDTNLVRLNKSATQVHFYTRGLMLNNGVVRLNDEAAAYDLVTGAAEEPRPHLSELRLYNETRSVIEAPPIEIDIDFDREHWRWDAVTSNPAGNKIVLQLVSNDVPFTEYWLIQNIETGEYFFPPETWSDTVFQG